MTIPDAPLPRPWDYCGGECEECEAVEACPVKEREDDE
jgi:hypothetical protein